MFTINQKIKSMEQTKETVPAGFQITFANGNTISIQFGFGNYCKNKFESKESCQDAEIAIWNKDDKWFVFDHTDSVKGYCTPDEVAYWIHFAQSNIF